MKSKYRKLEKMYQKIPEIECKGLCHKSCTIIPAATIEIKRAKERLHRNPFEPANGDLKKTLSSENPQIPTCGALKDKRCSIYTIRPAICRLYGAAIGLSCPYGCKPKTKMSKTDAMALIREIDEL